jgi:hypothetical protein
MVLFKKSVDLVHSGQEINDSMEMRMTYKSSTTMRNLTYVFGEISGAGQNRTRNREPLRKQECVHSINM